MFHEDLKIIIKEQVFETNKCSWKLIIRNILVGSAETLTLTLKTKKIKTKQLKFAVCSYWLASEKKFSLLKMRFGLTSWLKSDKQTHLPSALKDAENYRSQMWRRWSAPAEKMQVPSEFTAKCRTRPEWPEKKLSWIRVTRPLLLSQHNSVVIYL